MFKDKNERPTRKCMRWRCICGGTTTEDRMERYRVSSDGGGFRAADDNKKAKNRIDSDFSKDIIEEHDLEPEAGLTKSSSDEVKVPVFSLNMPADSSVFHISEKDDEPTVIGEHYKRRKSSIKIIIPDTLIHGNKI